MFGCGLLVAYAANLLVLGFVDVGEVTVGMLAGGINCFAGCKAAIITDDLALTFIHTGCFLQDFSVFPIMGLCLFQITLGANAAVLAVTCLCPFAEIVLTGCLNTGDAAVIAFLIAGVGFLITLRADLIFLVRMVFLDLNGIVVITTGIAGTTAGVIGGAEVEITDLALANHNAMTVITVGTGVTFNGIEISALGVVYKTNMAEALFK